MNIAIIPAKRESKRLPRKNLANIKGDVLVWYTVYAAIKSKQFHKIVIATDSTEIVDDLSHSFPFSNVLEHVLLNPELTASDVPVTKTIEFVASQYDITGFICYLLPTAPMRNQYHIMDAVHLARSKNRECSVVSVTHCDLPQLAGQIIGDEFLPTFDNLQMNNVNSQVLPKYYKPNGAIYISTINKYKETRTFFSPPVYPFVMSKRESIDIDDQFDLEVARWLMGQSSQ